MSPAMQLTMAGRSAAHGYACTVATAACGVMTNGGDMSGPERDEVFSCLPQFEIDWCSLRLV